MHNDQTEFNQSHTTKLNILTFIILFIRGSKSPDPFWHHVGLFYDQMVGLYQGYRASVKDTTMDVITLEDIVTMNIFGDLEDLEQVFDTNDHEAPKVQGIGHCSALIRLIPNNTDL